MRVFGILLALAALTGACGGRSVFWTTEIPKTPIPASYFGMHLHYVGNTKPWPDMQIGAFRTHDSFGTRWAQVQPERNKWDFARLDQMVQMCRARDVDVLITLGHTPAWAAKRPRDKSAYGPYMNGGPSEPANLDDWKRYVQTIARRYKGMVKNYEVWNEPDAPGFYTGSIETMVEMTKIARYELKAIDPDITVVSPSPSGIGERWFAEFLAAGGGRFVDVIGYHLYLPERALPEEAFETVNRIRSIMAYHKLGDLPLWNTESTIGRSPTTVYTGEKGAGIIARAMILYWTAGVSRFYWYSFDNIEHTGVPLVEKDGFTPNVAAQAFGRIQGWLTDSTMLSCSPDSAGTWVASFRRADRTLIWLVWNPNAAVEFAIPGSWQVTKVQTLDGDLRKLSRPGQTTADVRPKLLVGG